MKKLIKKFLFRLIVVLLVFGIIIFGAAFDIYICLNNGSTWDVAESVSLGIFIFFTIVQIITIFYVLYKHSESELKIPWIIIIIVLPIAGVIFYFMFSQRGLKKSQERLLDTCNSFTSKYFEKNNSVEEVANYKKPFDFLINVSNEYPFTKNKVTYYKNGETFFPDFINCLKKAKRFIFMEFFIINDESECWKNVFDVLQQKAKEGIEIRLLYDDIGCAGIVRFKFYKIMQKYGINAKIFNKFKVILSGSYNNRDHRKIVVIDHKYAFTGGMNLADEYANVNSPYGYWKDVMVKIQGDAIKSFIRMFLLNFDLTTKATSDYGKYFDFDYSTYKEEGLIVPFGHGPGPFYKERIGELTFINLIESAKSEITISSPYFIPTENLLHSIRRAALNGIKVNLILPGVPDKKIVYRMGQSYFHSLIECGINIYIYKPGFNHQKTILVDDCLAFVGTINTDIRSLMHHFECGLLLYKSPCIKDIERDLNKIIKECSPITKDFKIGKGTHIICALLKILQPML